MRLKSVLSVFFFVLLFSNNLVVFSQNRLVIQAEEGTYSGKTDQQHPGFTGSGFVDTENAVGAYLQIEFSVKDIGETTIHIFYAHGKTDDRTASVHLNKQLSVASLSFPPTGAFTSWSEIQAQVVLVAGTNVLKLMALTSGGLVNIDKIEIEGEAGPIQYKLNLNITGGGTVNVSPNAAYYDAGTVLALDAVDTDLSRFDHWEGALSGTEKHQTLVMDKTQTVKACFVKTKASVYHCSPNGNDATADGSFEKPFYNVQKAIDLASGGDTIYLKGGPYNYSTRININQSGDEKNSIALFSIPGQRAILDFSSMADADANQGIRLTGSYWHFFGFDISGAGDNGLLIERNKPSGGSYSDVAALTDQAHHNTIEFCNFYRNRDSGLQLKNLAENNRIVNCDSYFNRDASDGDADGFAPKMTVGTGNYFYGCRAWQNSDDGWDLYLKCKDDGFPQDMVTTIENCWCWNNGFLEDGSESEGNGNGFKLGGSGDKDERHDAVLIRCLAFDNLQKGFDQNNNMGNMTLINCTGFATPYTSNSSHYTYRIDGTTLPKGKKLIEINNLAVWDGETNRKKSKWALCEMLGGQASTCNYQVADSNFVSVVPDGVDAARKVDGSLPDIDFMKIKPGNQLLIDKGTLDEKTSFLGSAPDLGCFEALNTLGITLKMIGNEFVVYPNPCRHRAQAIVKNCGFGNLNCKIFDEMGREVFCSSIWSDGEEIKTFELPVNQLRQGVYFLVVKNWFKSYSSRLIVL